MDKTFADIFSQWEKTHNEDLSISKRVESDEKLFHVEPTVSQLRSLPVQAELDLHNLKTDEAFILTNRFIEDSYKKHLRKVRIITGKGLHSPDGIANVRPVVLSAIHSSKYIREFDANPKAKDGGSGAVILLLKSSL